MFEFMPEERALEEAHSEGNIHETEDVIDDEIVETIRKATEDRVGAALLSDDGVFTVRSMMAALMFHTECDAQAALEHIQGKIWERIGSRPGARLNCYSLIFKPLCARLHVENGWIDDLVPDHKYLRAQIDVHDYASRIHPNLYSETGITGLQRFIDRYGHDLVITTVVEVVCEPGGSDKEPGHISTWSFFDRAIKEAHRRQQMGEAHIAPGDVCGMHMRMDVPF